MAHFVTDRIVTGLHRTGTVLLVLGLLTLFGGINWTTSPDALVAASLIAGVAFGAPAAVVFGVAFWLDGHTATIEGRRGERRTVPRDEAARHPFREPLLGYGAAIGAVVAAGGLRMVVEPYVTGNLPFITFILGVAVAGWLGGFGPALVATMLSIGIARYFYMVPFHSFQLPDIATGISIGLFVVVCVGVGAITAALHSSLRRIQYLSNRLAKFEALHSDRQPTTQRPAASIQGVEPPTAA